MSILNLIEHVKMNFSDNDINSLLHCIENFNFSLDDIDEFLCSIIKEPNNIYVNNPNTYTLFLSEHLEISLYKLNSKSKRDLICSNTCSSVNLLMKGEATVEEFKINTDWNKDEFYIEEPLIKKLTPGDKYVTKSDSNAHLLETNGEVLIMVFKILALNRPGLIFDTNKMIFLEQVDSTLAMSRIRMAIELATKMGSEYTYNSGLKTLISCDISSIRWAAFIAYIKSNSGSVCDSIVEEMLNDDCIANVKLTNRLIKECGI